MSIQVKLHRTHRQHTGGRETIDVQGKTVGECLKNMVKEYPGLGKEIFDRKGNLSNIVEVYLNGASAFPNELMRPVTDGDVIQLVYFLAGG